MKQVMLFIVCILITLSAFAQENPPDYTSKSFDIGIYVNSFTEAENKINELILQENAEIQSITRNINQKKLMMTLYVDQEGYNKIYTELFKLGLVYQNNGRTLNNSNQLETIKVELAYLKQQKKYYEDEIENVDQEIYESFWDKIREFDKAIFEKEQEELRLLQEVKSNRLNINIQEKSPQDLEHDQFEFINMPGVEFIYFSLDDAEEAISSEEYMGGMLKYMFTKGKTYINIGFLKSVDDVDSDNTEQIDDIFYYGIGHDFYPKYMGRGRRKFLNLYSGFVFGGLLLNSEESTDGYAHFNPHIGVELFKNRYVILDVKGGYFIPLNERINRSFRGFTANASFNFVF